MSNHAERFKLLQDRVQECVNLASRLYFMKMPEVGVHCTIKGKTAGRAWSKAGKYWVDFNRQMFSDDKHFDNLLKEVVPHEVAHIVCFANPNLGRKHDSGWKKVCRDLGGNGRRCHDFDLENAGGSVYYVTTNGHVVAVSKILHTKIQRGRSYRYRNGKGCVNSSCTFSMKKIEKPEEIVQQPVQARPPAPVEINIPRPVVTGKKVSNAERVRETIRNNRSQGVAYVVSWAVANLGMSKALATTYVKGNWDKA